jgi:hypothetical protein
MTSSTTLLSSRYSCKGSSAVNQNSVRQCGYAPQTRLLCHTLARLQLPCSQEVRTSAASQKSSDKTAWYT